jgi:hypothetical protein
MTTDPGLPRTPSVTSPRPATRVVSVSSPGAILGGVLFVVLGIALGVANQGADEAALALRVPALLAALLMVGQGVVYIRRNLPHQQFETVTEQYDQTLRGRELAVVRPMPPAPPVQVLATKPNPANLTAPLAVMVLAAWLGLADLREAAPDSLTVLALVSAFALFAIGWSLMPTSK